MVYRSVRQRKLAAGNTFYRRVRDQLIQRAGLRSKLL
jgi:hypothetical protein